MTNYYTILANDSDSARVELTLERDREGRYYWHTEGCEPLAYFDTVKAAREGLESLYGRQGSPWDLRPVSQKEKTAAELAESVKKWRKAGDMTAKRAADVLGMPKRTLDGVEQGKGFRYPRLLMLAILSFGDAKMTKAEFYIQYDANHGPDPETCVIGTARDLRIGDDLGERLPGNDFDDFGTFLAINDRDLAGDDWWIENRAAFVEKAEIAGWGA